MTSTTEDCDDIGEPARKKRKLDTTETSKRKERSPSEENWAQPIIRSPRKQQKGRPIKSRQAKTKKVSYNLLNDEVMSDDARNFA